MFLIMICFFSIFHIFLSMLLPITWLKYISFVLILLTQNIKKASPSEFGTIVSETSQTPTSLPPSTTTQSSSKISDPPPHTCQHTRICKSTRLPDFSYSSFSLSFASFFTSAHGLSEHVHYKDVVRDSFLADSYA